MTYCRKCGAKLEETAKFCHICGTAVATLAPVATSRPVAPRRRGPAYLLPVTILIAILITAVIITAVIFLPVTHVNLNETRQLDSEGDVDKLVFSLQADVAQVNVFFENLPDKMLLLNVTTTGWTGLLGDPAKSVAVTFYNETINDTTTATSRVSHANIWPPQFSLNVICDLYIDPSAALNLTIHSDVGQITMNAEKHINLEELNLETETGSIDVNLSKDVTVAGTVKLKSTTGDVQANINDADVSGNVSVNLQSTTGSLEANLTETQIFSGNATVNAQTTTGTVNLFMVIEQDVGARIESDTNTGRISVDVKRFSGNLSPLQSNNYPAKSNFLVNLHTSTGRININAAYGSSTILS